MRSRKIIILTLTLTVVLVTLIPLRILESRRTPDWQSELNQYFELSDIPRQDASHVWVAEARQVNPFPPELLHAVPMNWTWQSIATIPPPTKIRCIRLDEPGDTGSELSERTANLQLLVGYHDDGLWRSGWLVHEFRGDVSTPVRLELFARLGCIDWQKISTAGS